MIEVWNLAWIIPLSMFAGMALMCIVVSASDREDNAYKAGLKQGRKNALSEMVINDPLLSDDWEDK